MPLLGPRRDEPELMDRPLHAPAELGRSLEHVAAVNRWLGGDRSLRRHLAPLRGQDVRVLDVGTGNAAVLRRILRWGARGGGRWSGVGVDVHPQVLALAREGLGPALSLALVRADALSLPFASGSFDVALCTLTLHHFTDDEAGRLLAEMARVARRLVLVSDLERRPLAYLGARLLSLTWWRRNRITRNDGPLSVLRSFTRGELGSVGEAGGLDAVRVRRHFPFRLVLEGRPRASRGRGAAGARAKGARGPAAASRETSA